MANPVRRLTPGPGTSDLSEPARRLTILADVVELVDTLS